MLLNYKFVADKPAIYICVGRVASWEPNPTTQIPWLIKSYEKYQWIVKNAPAHLPKSEPTVRFKATHIHLSTFTFTFGHVTLKYSLPAQMLEAELKLAKEAVELLPVQISRLKRAAK